MLHTSVDWTPFGQHMIDFIKKDKARKGVTQKETERNLAVHYAEVELIAQSMAYLGTQMRVSKLAPLMEKLNEQRRWVPMVEQHEVRQWLQTVRQRWDDGEWKSVDDTVFLQQVSDEFENIVYDNELIDQIQGYRKQLILAGAMAPEPADREWLEKEYENLTAVHRPYAQALEKLDLQDRHSKERLANREQGRD